MNVQKTQAAKELLVPAIRARMGDWWFYVATVTFRDLADRVKRADEIHEKKELKTWIQRDITEVRLHEIADYVQSQPQHFFNAIVLGLFLGEPDWMPINVSKNLARPDIEVTDRIETAFGMIRLSGEEDIFAIDGQHRVEGIKLVLKNDKTGELQNEEQSVIFLAHKPTDEGRERTRRLFTTLNKYAKPVSKAEIIALSEDDTFALVVRRLIDSYPGLSTEFVPLLPNLAANDKKSVTSLIALYDVVNTISLPVGKTRKQLVIGPPDPINVETFLQIAIDFWDALKKHVPAVNEVYESDPDEELSSKYRNKEGGNLLFRPIGLVAIAKAVRVLMDRGLSVEDSVHSLTQVSLDIAEDPWRYVVWNPIKKTVNQRNARLIKNLLLVEGGHKPDPQGMDMSQAYLQAIGEAQATYLPPQV